MADIQSILELDREFLFFFNGSDSLFVDGLMATFTSGFTWIPLYVGWLYLVIKNNETFTQVALTVCAALLCLFLADGVSEGIVKPLVGRLRPCNDPSIRHLVDVVEGVQASDYSFFSGHASNTFSLAVFFCLLVRSRIFNAFMITWSLLNCYTRLYLGMHYPTDILTGLVWGALVGASVYWVYFKLYFKITPKLNYVSTQYTYTGYSRVDIDIVISLLVFCLLYSVVRAFLYIV
ncbi:MAG: phosphatase PAP2 family protein [Prevotella sp.]|nr:phosphatase PAP2 family protein [Prevotella sp.]